MVAWRHSSPGTFKNPKNISAMTGFPSFYSRRFSREPPVFYNRLKDPTDWQTFTGFMIFSMVVATRARKLSKGKRKKMQKSSD